MSSRARQRENLEALPRDAFGEHRRGQSIDSHRFCPSPQSTSCLSIHLYNFVQATVSNRSGDLGYIFAKHPQSGRSSHAMTNAPVRNAAYAKLVRTPHSTSGLKQESLHPVGYCTCFDARVRQVSCPAGGQCRHSHCTSKARGSTEVMGTKIGCTS